MLAVNLLRRLHSMCWEHPDDDSSVIVMDHPFDEVTMEPVFAKVDASDRRMPRTIKVAYANSVHEEPLNHLGWLRKIEEWPPRFGVGFLHPISFWVSEQPRPIAFLTQAEP